MDVFISYRRNGGIEIARLIKMALNKEGYTTFFDNDSIREGKFDEQILKNIMMADNVILILSPNALDRCVNEDDWVRKEIEGAIKAGRTIIPITCDGFVVPDNMPDFIREAVQFQGVPYNPMMFEEVIRTLISYLKDKDGMPLRIAKTKNISNTFYQGGNMSEEERRRIQNDYKVVKSAETKIWDELLADRKDVILLAPAVYDVDTYMQKYLRPEVKQIFGLVNFVDEMEYANKKYGEDGHRFYVGNMEDDDFDRTLDGILSDNELSGFDLADLTLILRDLQNPVDKLKDIVDRMNRGGIIYVREFDHGIVQAYPDDDKKFAHLLKLLELDVYSGDFYAGRKVFSQMRDAYLEDIGMSGEFISTIGMNKRQRDCMFDALFSYIPREYKILAENESYNKSYHDAVIWLEENYERLKRQFLNEDFFYRAGHEFFWGFVD